jgi:TolA-binding protein
MQIFVKNHFCFIFIISIILFGDICVAVGEEKGHIEYEQGMSALKEGNYDAAEAHFKAALGVSPQNLIYHYFLGKTYLLEKAYEKAKVHFYTAWKGHPDIPGLKYPGGMMETSGWNRAMVIFIQTKMIF